MTRMPLLGLVALLVLGCSTNDERTAWERYVDAATEYGDQGDFNRAFRACDAAVRIAEESEPATSDSLLASSLMVRGYLYEAQGDDPAAEREYMRALELWSRLGSVAHGGVAMHTLAALYERQGRTDEARIWLTRIPAPMRNVTSANNRIAACLAAQHRYHEADSLYTTEIERLTERHGANHWILAPDLLRQAQVRLAANAPLTAAPLLEQAAGTLLSAPVPVHPELLRTMDACAAELMRTGEKTTAAALSARAKTLRDRRQT